MATNKQGVRVSDIHTALDMATPAARRKGKRTSTGCTNGSSVQKSVEPVTPSTNSAVQESGDTTTRNRPQNEASELATTSLLLETSYSNGELPLHHAQQATTTTSKKKLIAFGEWLETLRVPARLSPTGERVALISGLDGMMYRSVPAAQTVRVAGIRPHQYFFYMFSGFTCDIVQFAMDVVLHCGLRIRDPSLCWSIGFILSIIPRHSSLRYLVFGDYVGGYWASLGRMYFGFSFSIVLSTVFNIIMTRYLDISHYVAWVFTLIWTGIVNYFILKKLWSFGGAAEKATSE